jgi:hypothetical protein
MTTTHRLLGLTLILALVGAAPAGAVELVYKPKVGETVQHKVMLAGRLSVTASNPELASFLDQRGEMTTAIRYSAAPASQSDDSTVVDIRMLNGQAVVKTESGAETVDLGTLTAKLTTDRRLETGDAEFEIEEDFTETSGEAYSVLDGFAILAGDWWDLVDVLYLPAGDVSTGAEWQYEDAEGRPSESAPPFVVRYKLLDLTTHEGRKCAKIRASWRYEFSDMKMEEEGEGEEADATTGSGVHTGDYLLYYDYENSVCAYSEGSVGLEISVQIPSPSGIGTASMKALVNVKTALE